MERTILIVGISALLILGYGRASYAQQSSPSIGDAHGREFVYPYSELKEGQRGLYVFPRRTKLRRYIIPKGAKVVAEVRKDQKGKMALFTVEPLITASGQIPEGTRIPFKCERSER
jgi:hypothetical protein